MDYLGSKYVIQPKTARGEKTLSKIFKASEKLFKDKGYYETSIIDIITLAEVSNGTFYNYFVDKMSLFKYMLERYSHEIRKTSSVASKKHQTRYEKEFYGFKAYIEYLIQHPQAYCIIMQSMYVQPDFYKDYYERFCEKYRNALDEAIENGEIYPCDTTVVSYMLMGISSFYGLKHVIFDHKYDVSEEDIKKVFDILAKGLFTDKAYVIEG